MAGRSMKVKDYRIGITSVDHWLKELQFPGLVVAELYSAQFGSCECMVPFIEQIVLGIDDPDEKLKWVSINVCKIEDDQRIAIASAEKKKEELESALRRKEKEDQDSGSSSATSSMLDDEAMSMADVAQVEMVSIPILENYSGIVSAMPIYLLIKDGQIIARVVEANPPLLKKLVTMGVNDVAFSPNEANLDIDILDLIHGRDEDDADIQVDGDEDPDMAKLQAEYDAERGPVVHVQMDLKCRNLTSVTDSYSKCDPILEIRRLNNFTGNYELLGVTEHLQNVNGPEFEFETNFVLDFYAHDEETMIKITVFDVDQPVPLNQSDAMGSIKMDLTRLLSAGERQAMCPIVDRDGQTLDDAMVVATFTKLDGEEEVEVVDDETVDYSSPIEIDLHVSCRGLPMPMSTSGDGDAPPAESIIRPQVIMYERVVRGVEAEAEAAMAAAAGESGDALPVQEEEMWKRMGQTEHQERRDPDADFQTPIPLDYIPCSPSIYKLSVYNIENEESAPTPENCLGSSVINITRVILSDDQHLTVPLCDADGNAIVDGSMTVYAESLTGSFPKLKRENIPTPDWELSLAEEATGTQLQMCCNNLPQNDVDSKSDPLVAVFMKRGNESTYTLVSATERIMNDEDPTFQKLVCVPDPPEEPEPAPEKKKGKKKKKKSAAQIEAAKKKEEAKARERELARETSLLFVVIDVDGEEIDLTSDCIGRAECSLTEVRDAVARMEIEVAEEEAAAAVAAAAEAEAEALRGNSAEANDEDGENGRTSGSGDEDNEDNDGEDGENDAEGDTREGDGSGDADGEATESGATESNTPKAPSIRCGLTIPLLDKAGQPIANQKSAPATITVGIKHWLKDIARVQGRLAFFFRAQDLPKADKSSQTDPLIIVAVNGEEVGRTEIIPNNCNPTWLSGVMVAYDYQGLDQSPILDFHVFDSDQSSPNDLLGLVRAPLQIFSTPDEGRFGFGRERSFQLQAADGSGEVCVDPENLVYSSFKCRAIQMKANVSAAELAAQMASLREEDGIEETGEGDGETTAADGASTDVTADDNADGEEKTTDGDSASADAPDAVEEVKILTYEDELMQLSDAVRNGYDDVIARSETRSKIDATTLAIADAVRREIAAEEEAAEAARLAAEQGSDDEDDDAGGVITGDAPEEQPVTETKAAEEKVVEEEASAVAEAPQEDATTKAEEAPADTPVATDSTEEVQPAAVSSDETPAAASTEETPALTSTEEAPADASGEEAPAAVSSEEAPEATTATGEEEEKKEVDAAPPAEEQPASAEQSVADTASDAVADAPSPVEEKTVEPEPVVDETPAVAPAPVVHKVSIRVSAKNLPKLDRFSKSDPIAALYRRPEGAESGFSFVAQTEAKKNDHDPVFEKTLDFEVREDAAVETRKFKICLYDVDDNEQINQDDLLGVAELNADDFQLPTGGQFEFKLVDKEGQVVQAKDGSGSIVLLAVSTELSVATAEPVAEEDVAEDEL